ncbi:MAG: hypothetical protein BZ136_09105, partial [Methanosphaera sp. rholeuAM74]
KNTTIEITLKDTKTQNNISNAEITITLPDAQTITDKTDNNGKLTKKLDLPAGTNKITITYPGNRTYKEATTDLTVDVEKIATNIMAEIVNNTAG